MYCLGILLWALFISGWYTRKLSRMFEFRIEPVHPDHCGGLKLLGNFCFGLVSTPFIGSAFFIGYILIVLRDPTDIAALVTSGLIAFILLLYGLPVVIFVFALPLWNIHRKMLKERETAEETYTAHIAALREQIQVLLDDNQLEEAKAVKEKKELMEALYIPYPTWPFNVKAKLFSTVLGAAGSFLLGFLTALPPVILHIIFPKISPI